MAKNFEEIWTEATEKADLKYNPRGALAWRVFLKEELKIRVQPLIQQPALPVVPECVAELIKDAKENKKTIRWCLYGNCKELYPQAAEWIGAVDDIEFTDKTWKQQETFVRAWLDGYEVEKPQLFYLKHIDMSKADKECDYFAQIRNDRFEHESVQNNTLPGVEVVGVRFTQAEIDSMQTGSYEQIEAAE